MKDKINEILKKHHKLILEEIKESIEAEEIGLLIEIACDDVYCKVEWGEY